MYPPIDESLSKGTIFNSVWIWWDISTIRNSSSDAPFCRKVKFWWYSLRSKYLFYWLRAFRRHLLRHPSPLLLGPRQGCGGAGQEEARNVKYLYKRSKSRNDSLAKELAKRYGDQSLVATSCNPCKFRRIYNAKSTTIEINVRIEWSLH